MISREELRELLNYDPETGIFRWRKSINNRVKVGDIPHATAGKGYYTVQIYGQRYYLHRLAFFYMTGEWPKQCVDHKNGVVTDNRWSNLRHASVSQNAWNMRCQTRAASPYKGVWLNKRINRWTAEITVNKKKRYLGSFLTQEEAAFAYQEAAKKLQGEFFRAA